MRDETLELFSLVVLIMEVWNKIRSLGNMTPQYVAHDFESKTNYDEAVRTAQRGQNNQLCNLDSLTTIELK